MDVTADFSELGRLNTLLAGASNQATTKMPQILDDVSNAVVVDAKGRAPVESGALRDSIGVLERSGNRLARHRIIGSPLRQAFFQEFGTSEHGPQPSITPAAEAGVERLLERIAEIGEPW